MMTIAPRSTLADAQDLEDASEHGGASAEEAAKLAIETGQPVWRRIAAQHVHDLGPMVAYTITVDVYERNLSGHGAPRHGKTIERLAIVPAAGALAERLGVRPGTLVLELDRTVHASDGRPFEWRRTYARHVLPSRPATGR